MRSERREGQGHTRCVCRRWWKWKVGEGDGDGGHVFFIFPTYLLTQRRDRRVNSTRPLSTDAGLGASWANIGAKNSPQCQQPGSRAPAVRGKNPPDPQVREDRDPIQGKTKLPNVYLLFGVHDLARRRKKRGPGGGRGIKSIPVEKIITVVTPHPSGEVSFWGGFSPPSSSSPTANLKSYQVAKRQHRETEANIARAI